MPKRALTGQAEDYLKAIYELEQDGSAAATTEIASRLGLSDGLLGGRCLWALGLGTCCCESDRTDREPDRPGRDHRRPIPEPPCDMPTDHDRTSLLSPVRLTRRSGSLGWVVRGRSVDVDDRPAVLDAHLDPRLGRTAEAHPHT